MGPVRGTDTVIVYDASGSMWGQIDGEAKITIARRVMADLIRTWDEDTNIGLVAYGHRRAGDCTDIETVAPVGPVEREALIAHVESLQPNGKTPLTDAVRHAAELLKFRDNPATVVLVSDGIESCDADPCAVSEDLARAGIRFTAHVVGFDVTAESDQQQLRCIADNTGGQFFAARDARGLEEALGEVAELASEPDPEPEPEPEVTVSAPESAVGGSQVRVTWSGETRERDMITIVPAGADADARGRYERVRDKDSTVLTAPADTGPHEARYVSHTSGLALASAPMELTEPEPVVTAPESVTAGAAFAVSWEYPVHPRDYVTIVPADAPADEYAGYIRVDDKRSGSLTAPAEPGDYEVRYMLQEGGLAIARAPVQVVTESVSVSAPENVTGGADFVVSWDNAIHPRDYVTVVPSDAPADHYASYIRVGDKGSGNLTAPAEPGNYEVRYVLQENGRAIASAPIHVTGQDVDVSAPEEVRAGSSFTVSWTDVVHPRDYVTIVPADAPDGEYATYARVRDRRSDSLTAPAEAGDYEVRYMLQEDRRVLARAPVRVAVPETDVSAPESVTGGSQFTVSWTSVIHPRDYVTIVPAAAPDGEYGTYTRVRDHSSDSLTAPAEAGDYEVRYMLQEGRKVLARAPVRVEAPVVGLEAPQAVGVEAAITVRWDNPIHPRDYVTIVPAGAPADEYGKYIRVQNRNEGGLAAPAEPGSYEVRYVLQESGRAIASVPVQVE